MPAEPRILSSWPECPEQLTEAQRSDFQEDGYLAFDAALTPEQVETAREELSRLVRETVEAQDTQNENVSGSLEHPVGNCAVQFEPGIDVQSLDDAALELKVRKLMWFCSASPWFENASMSHPHIEGVLNALIGPGFHRFQDMALIKPPRIGSIKPWHQDNAYFAVTPLDQIIGVWIALDDATVENGCMYVIPGGHLQGARKHYHDRDCEIMPDRIDESQAQAIELKAGGVLFFYGMLPHQTPPNTSAYRRRALQWHYRGADTVELAPQEYDTIFAEADGTPASCRAAR